MKVKRTTYRDNKKLIEWIDIPDPKVEEAPVPELGPGEDFPERAKDEE